MESVVEKLDLGQLRSDLKSALIAGTPVVVAYLYLRGHPFFRCPACTDSILSAVVVEGTAIVASVIVGMSLWAIVLMAKISVESLIDRYTVQQGGDSE